MEIEIVEISNELLQEYTANALILSPEIAGKLLREKLESRKVIANAVKDVENILMWPLEMRVRQERCRVDEWLWDHRPYEGTHEDCMKYIKENTEFINIILIKEEYREYLQITPEGRWIETLPHREVFGDDDKNRNYT